MYLLFEDVELARNMQRFSTDLGYYGAISDIYDVMTEIFRATETTNWRPVIVKLETLAAGRVATVISAFAFSLIFSAPPGIVGYAIIMGLVKDKAAEDKSERLSKPGAL